MKKHLTSIQSTRPGEQGSIFSYDDREMKLNYKSQILKLFNQLRQIISLRSYLLYRDFEDIYKNCETLFIKVIASSNVNEFWQFAFPNLKHDEKVHQKDQVAFLVKIVLQMDKMRKSAANYGRTKQFQSLKSAIQLLQQKIAQHQQAIRKKKYGDKLQKKMKQKQEKQKHFINFQRSIRQNLQSKHRSMKSSLLQKIHSEDENSMIQTQKAIAKHLYKVKPSKLLSQAKDLSLRVKLSPYAAELKRNYDYKTLESSLSKTLDLDMNRKLSMISHMKKVQKQKLNRQHHKRYSVMSDHMGQEKNMVERDLQHEKQHLDRSINIDMSKLYQKNIRKEYERIHSLQKSLNAYNMHSDTKQIKRIIRNHKETIQFSNQISEVGNLRTGSFYEPKYGTLTNRMLQDEYVTNQIKRQSSQQNKILRKFTKSKKQIEKDCDSDAQADDICGSNRQIKPLPRQKSLVALYDNQLKEVK